MDIFIITKSFPEDEKYSLTNQTKLSSRSVGTQIAEEWSKSFVAKLIDSQDEACKTSH